MDEAARFCPDCGAMAIPGQREPEDRITQNLARHAEDEHPDIRQLMAASSSNEDDDPGPDSEPEVIVVREPRVITGQRDHDAYSQGASQNIRATSCYVNRSCPTCLPCCIAMFVAPMVFMIWPLIPDWQKTREINNRSTTYIPGSETAASNPDPASDRLKQEVQQMQFASRAEIETFISARNIGYEKRTDGYWIATDRAQQAALVILQQRWLELPAESPTE